MSRRAQLAESPIGPTLPHPNGEGLDTWATVLNERLHAEFTELRRSVANTRDGAVFADDVVKTSVTITSADSPYELRDDDSIVYVDTSGGNITLTTLAAAAVPNREYRIKKITADTNTITIDPNASENVDLAATYVFGSTGGLDARVLHSDGTAWWIL